MSDEASRHIGKGIAWLGFWLMIGLVNFGEGFDIKPTITALIEVVDKNIIQRRQ